MLDLLLDQPLITGEIASYFRISRIAVMRHLNVLSEAGLVVSRKTGRERRYYLNPIPLQQIEQRWFDPKTAGWASGMLRLRGRVEGEGLTVTNAQPEVDIALDVRIGKSPAVVFKALTADPGAWWGHPMLRPQATALQLEARLAGLFIEHWGQGGAVLAAVTQWEMDSQLEMTGPFHLGLGVGIASFNLTRDGTGTLLRFSFRAFGPIDPDRANQFSQGWKELLSGRLKSFVERGTRLGIAPAPHPTGKRRRPNG